MFSVLSYEFKLIQISMVMFFFRDIQLLRSDGKQVEIQNKLGLDFFPCECDRVTDEPGDIC